MKKSISAIIIFSLLLHSGLLFAAGEGTDRFSNQKISPQTGDCGGYDLWLTKKGQSVQGKIAVYEGNCESEKWNIESVQYDPKTGALSFKAPYGEDFVWEFKGTLREDRVSGVFDLVEKAGKKKNFSQKVVLLKMS